MGRMDILVSGRSSLIIWRLTMLKKQKINVSRDIDHTFSKSVPSVIKLLIKDHKNMRKLMDKIQSQKATPKSIIKTFALLKDIVNSHMIAEEKSLVNHLRDHPQFADEATESYEEHRIHENIFWGISRLKDEDRKIAQMKIYCEMLEHHLDEEEEDLFPRYKKYFALSTRKKAGKVFIKKRLQTKKKDEKKRVLELVK
jgi:hemerythrin-like domain-containing protein